MLYHETPFYVISTWCRLRLIEAIRVPGTVRCTVRCTVPGTWYTKASSSHQNFKRCFNTSLFIKAHQAIAFPSKVLLNLSSST